jgi:hypothetical protein
MSKRRTKPYVHNEFDTPWKDVLRSLFPEFMRFFFSETAENINWDAGYTVLDKELRKISRDAESGNRFADSLVRVERLSGEEVFIMLHVEIQGSPEASFAERMYTYNYRIFDRYRLPVASMAVLTDESATWRPNEFVSGIFGTEMRFRFETMKLRDFHATAHALMEQAVGTSINPFAVITLAHLQAQTSRGNSAEVAEVRFAAKVRLVRMLYAQHFTREQVVEVFRFLDWVLVLPEGLEDQLDTIIHTELENDMPYLSRFERKAIERGFEQGIEQGIERGIEQGIEQGKRVTTLETARNLLPILEDQQISAVTGLTLVEVAQLRNDM